MPHITVDDEQAKTIRESEQQIEIRDQSGKHLGFVAHRFTDEDITIAKQRLASGETRHSTRDVLDHLESLDRRWHASPSSRLRVPKMN